eukprot:2994318-Rhodomonas_salina.2
MQRSTTHSDCTTGHGPCSQRMVVLQLVPAKGATPETHSAFNPAGVTVTSLVTCLPSKVTRTSAAPSLNVLGDSTTTAAWYPAHCVSTARLPVYYGSTGGAYAVVVMDVP